MNTQELFSPEATSHLKGPKENRDYLENMTQLAWLETCAQPEEEFVMRSAWFREVFLLTPVAQSLLARFQEESETVVQAIESQYASYRQQHLS